eukprot:SAG11_NODE_82_length_17639_cov_6.427594_12_plen_58_part_00
MLLYRFALTRWISWADVMTKYSDPATINRLVPRLTGHAQQLMRVHVDTEVAHCVIED